jgi:hypothetical protein
MPDPTPAAAVAAPAAAPAAPAPAATPPAAAAPPAAPPAAPAAPPAAPAPAAAPPVADPGDSLLPPGDAPAPAVALTPEQQLAAARDLIKKAEEAANPNNGKSWLLNEGVMGVGEKPAWFKADKYATVAKQAEAYTALESRFGAFVGAPKNEKGEVAYTFKPPEGIEVSMDHPVMQDFTKWAAGKQLSQEGYSELLGMLVQYEAAQAPNIGAIKERLGENADTRIAAVAAWGKANLGNEGYATLRAATSGNNADAVFKVLEQVIGKTGQVKMPKPGDDVPGGQPQAGLAAIQARHGARDASGKLKIDTVPGYRAQIDKEYRDYYAAQA